MWQVALVFLFILSVLASEKVNYCGARMCGQTNAHTFCQYSGGAGPQCIGYVETPLSPEEKIRIVIRLNQRRAAVATGKLKGFPTAGNMMKLLWIEELAREAQLWADQCEPPSIPEENDACRDLYSVAVGQCAASVIGEAPGLRPESMVDIWYMQNMYYRGNITSYNPPVNNHYNYYGDFAQLVYSKTYMVGCGRSRFMVLMSGRLRSVERLVCNFAPRGPNSGRPLWTVASPGSSCPPRSQPDDNVPALCAVKPELAETHDQEDMMTLEENILLETVFEVERNDSINYLRSLDEIFLTKVAMATIRDIVTEQSDFNSFQKRELFVSNDAENASRNAQQNRFGTNRFAPKLILVGRPKSYNIEDLNEDDDDESKDDNIEMEDLPIKETQFDPDYEFRETTEEIKKTSVEQPSTSSFITIAPSSLISNMFYVTESKSSPDLTTVTRVEYKNKIDENSSATNTFPVNTSEMDKEFSNILNEVINTTSSDANDTDAFLEDYLSDPETVRRLQEELDRMEETMSTDGVPHQIAQTIPPDERAEKVRRALKDYGVTFSDQSQERRYHENASLHVPQMLEMFNENQNKSNNPMLSMVMRYLPFLRDYKTGLMHKALNGSIRFLFAYPTLIVILLLNNVL